jgi:site-specific recombinase XerD
MPLSRKDFSQNIGSFLKYRARIGYTASQTVRSDRIDLQLFERFLIENNIETINGKTVIAFQDYLVNKRNNCAASVNRKIFTLRAYQTFLELTDIPGSEKYPFKKVLKIRACRPLRANFLKQNEITKFFNTINIHSILGLRDYAIYALMYLLGLRVGEVFRLNLGDLNWQENRITISGKRDQKRMLTMNQEIKTILDKYLAVRSVIYQSEKSNALFISKKGNRLAIRTMEDNFQKLINVANINKRFPVTCHTLRHSCATMLNENGVKILTIQNILGHATPKTTMEYYLHTTEKSMRNALERLPLVSFIDELISSGTIKLTFQNQYRKRAG